MMLIALLGAILLTSLGWRSTTSTHLQFDCPPKDEATRDHQLVAVRARLRQAVARRDAPGVLALTSSEIRTSFGPEDGLEFFTRDLANKRSEIWDELRAVLALGGVFETPETTPSPANIQLEPTALSRASCRLPNLKTRESHAAPMLCQNPTRSGTSC